MSVDFLPVLLGSDINVYGMARSFYEEYGVKSVAIGKGILAVCTNTHILSVEVIEPRLEEDDVFVDTLLTFAKRYENSGKRLLLVPCGDNYIKYLVRNQDRLRGVYEFNCISEELLMRLSIKDSFYKVCTEHGFLFPKTTTCTFENYKGFDPGMEFPLIVKPTNSVAYWNCSFPHKKKVFVAQDEKEFRLILDAIYGSSYKDPLIVQEYIPGADSNMRVMNCYSGRDKKVRLIALGHAILEEHTPFGIGSYAAIISGAYDKELCEQIKGFLEDIGYVGFSNFDIKLDPRDGKYKMFEMNLRQGRSSYYVTAAGCNLAKYLVEDVLECKPAELEVCRNRVLWKLIPKSVIFKYVESDEVKAEVKELIRSGKVSNSYYCSADRSFKRWLRYIKNQIIYINSYKKYFNNKGVYR